MDIRVSADSDATRGLGVGKMNMNMSTQEKLIHWGWIDEAGRERSWMYWQATAKQARGGKSYYGNEKTKTRTNAADKDAK